jgi:hypothetical protein
MLASVVAVVVVAIMVVVAAAATTIHAAQMVPGAGAALPLQMRYW